MHDLEVEYLGFDAFMATIYTDTLDNWSCKNGVGTQQFGACLCLHH
jgi:hypothetical protein